ncbi:MAG: hypothetical protein HY898_10525 [Deltaproteobacteria bacterium]|nr:hypothetical protein [Deltaproteobacteria bacterium]
MDFERSSPRSAALAFMRGTKAPWGTAELLEWINEHLLRPDRITLAPGSRVLEVFEPDAGTLSLECNSFPPGRVAPLPAARPVIALARERVLQRLRAMVEHGHMSFVHAALYQQRLVRCKSPSTGSQVWCVRFKEDTCLSDQILALFAADAMESPDDYEHRFGVCRICDEVHFQATVDVLRVGCEAHPLGVLHEGPIAQRNPTVPEMSAVRPGRRK